jgi:hypothetical protein
MSLRCCCLPYPALTSHVSAHISKHASTPATGSIWALDVPTWITAIATVGLLVGATITAIYAAKAFGKQAKEVGILVAQSQREAAERRQAQAARVFVGAPQPAQPNAGTVPHAKNASDLPIYDAQFWYDGTGTLNSDALGMIMPGKKISGSGSVIFSAREQAVSGVILTFIDAAGVRWIRMPDGALDEQSRATARESVQAALEHNLPDGYDRQYDQITGSVADAIVVYPRSHGELRMPGEYSSSLKLGVKVNSPPELEVTVTSEDGSTQGVYHRSRIIGSMEHLTLVWDVWNHRDSRVFARLILPGQADQAQADTRGG